MQGSGCARTSRIIKLMFLIAASQSLIRFVPVGQEAGLPSQAVSPAPRQRGATPLRLGTASAGNMAHEVDAFSSVQDMIHAAILTYGTRATLREVGTTAAVHGDSCTMQQKDDMSVQQYDASIRCCCVSV